MPETASLIAEAPEATGLFGAKGVGEPAPDPHGAGHRECHLRNHGDPGERTSRNPGEAVETERYKMIIDAHTHMMNAEYLDRLGTLGGGMAREHADYLLGFKQKKPQLTDVAYRIEQMDRNGIDMQVVTPFQMMDINRFAVDAKTQVTYAGLINDSMSTLMEKSKGRLVAVGNIPLEAFDQGGRIEMERAIKTLGLRAMFIPSHIKGKPLDSPEFEPFWALAAELDVPVYMHPINPIGTAGRPYEAEYDLIHNFGWLFETTLMLTRLVFSGIMERYPTLKVVNHHLGGMIPFFMGRTQETYEPENQKKNWGGVVLDLPKPLIEYFRCFYYDTAVGGSAAAVRCTYEVFGAGSIVFATDSPWGSGTGEFRLTEYPKMIKSLGLPEGDTRKILGENIAKIMKI